MTDPEAAAIIDSLTLTIVNTRAHFDSVNMAEAIHYLFQARREHPDLPPFKVFTQLASEGILT